MFLISLQKHILSLEAPHLLEARNINVEVLQEALLMITTTFVFIPKVFTLIP